MDLGIALLRIVVGALFIGHGTQKLFAWFGGQGLDGTAGFMESLGYRPGKLHATLAGLGEALGGLLLVLGLFIPLGCAAIIAVMVNAIGSVHAGKGLWVTEGGYEYNLVLIMAALALAFYYGGGEWGGLATLGGLGGGALTLSLREQPAAEEETAADEAEREERRAA
jgi:putative oxidoreductase